MSLPVFRQRFHALCGVIGGGILSVALILGANRLGFVQPATISAVVRQWPEARSNRPLCLETALEFLLIQLVWLDMSRRLYGNSFPGMAEVDTNEIESRVVFSSADHPFTVRDVIDAAYFRGEVEPVWQDLLRSVAAENKADETELDVDDDAIDSAAEQFRYQHDLITAEETEKWLAERGLDLSDFTAYFVRHYWAENGEIGEVEETDYLSAPNELRELLPNELILSRDFDRMAQRSSWREASRIAAEKAPVDPQLHAEKKQDFLQRHEIAEAQIDDWLGKMHRDEEWLRRQIEMEAAYARDRAALLTRDALSREISALRLPLTNFQIELIELDSLDAAREALLCVRQDGMSMEEVATEGRYAFRQREVLLEDVPEDLQQKFLSVTPGDLLEPIERGDGFHLCRIIAKVEPHVDDPVVKERAENRILDRYFSELSARHIQWKNILA